MAEQQTLKTHTSLASVDDCVRVLQKSRRGSRDARVFEVLSTLAAANPESLAPLQSTEAIEALARAVDRSRADPSRIARVVAAMSSPELYRVSGPSISRAAKFAHDAASAIAASAGVVSMSADDGAVVAALAAIESVLASGVSEGDAAVALRATFKALATPRTPQVARAALSVAALAAKASGPALAERAAVEEHGLRHVRAAIEELAPKCAEQKGSLLGLFSSKGTRDPSVNSVLSVIDSCCPHQVIKDAMLNRVRKLDLSYGVTKMKLVEVEKLLLPFADAFDGLYLRGYGMTEIPAGLYKLTQLKFLSLQINKLVVIPCDIQALSALKTLLLCRNNLEVIPPSLKLLPNLEKLSVLLNPLRSMPVSVSTLSRRAVMNFVRDFYTANGEWKDLRLMVVGEEAAGKTSLIHRFRSNKFNKSNLSTDGISVSKLNIDDISFNAWDFGGQEVFLPTHQFFLTPKAEYIVVVNLTEYHESRVGYWLDQIEAVTSGAVSAPIILVGTHADEFASLDEAEAELRRIASPYLNKFTNIQSMVVVSNLSGFGFEFLRQELVRIANENNLLRTNVPLTWISFQKFLGQNVKKQKHVSWDTWKSWAATSGLLCPEGLALATEFFHSCGIVQHFDTEKLKSTVILDPQWLTEVVSSITSFSHKFGKKDGRLLRKELSQIWKSSDKEDQRVMEELLLKFEVAHWIEENTLLVPFLLPSERPEIPTSEWVNLPGAQCARVYQFSFFPLGFIGRLISHVLHTGSVKGSYFWQNGMIAKMDQQVALIEYQPDSRRVSFLVKNSDTSNRLMLRLLVQTIETTLEAFYPRLISSTARIVICPHCLDAQIPEPTEFSYEGCVSMSKSGENSLVCSHTESSILIRNACPDIAFTDMTVIDEKALEIHGEIGEGGFGKVFKGRWAGKVVAIKQLNVAPEDSEGAAFAAFTQEAFIMSTIHHTNLVKLFGISVSPARMVMEYVAGGDLQRLIRNAQCQDNSLSWDYRLNVAIDISKAMCYLQSIKPAILHRDLRSANIFLTGDRDGPVYAKVADFGMSRQLLPILQGALPNWEWLAPEVFTGKSYDKKSDVYSFGIILWELATLQRPFEEYAEDKRFATTQDRSGKPVISIIKLKDAIAEKGLRPTLPGPPCDKELCALISASLSGDPVARPSFEDIHAQLVSIRGRLFKKSSL